LPSRRSSQIKAVAFISSRSKWVEVSNKCI